MNNTKKKYTIMLIILMAVVFYAGARYGSVFPYMHTDSSGTEAQNIAVNVKGAVTQVGYYEMPAGSRLQDLFNINPPLSDADLSELNPARYLVDGEEIYVPSLNETTQAAMSATDKININTADVQELTRLNGIGEVKARAIITYREKHGDFRKINDIRKVTGIGDSTYKKIKDYICVE